MSALGLKSGHVFKVKDKGHTHTHANTFPSAAPCSCASRWATHSLNTQSWHTQQAEHPACMQDSPLPSFARFSQNPLEMPPSTAVDGRVGLAHTMVAAPLVLVHLVLSSPATKALATQGSSNSRTDQAPTADSSCQGRGRLVDTGQGLVALQ